MSAQEHSVVFDCGQRPDEEDFVQFLYSNGIEWNCVDRGVIGKTSCWASFGSQQEVDAFLGLLGRDYEGNVILVSRFLKDKHMNLIKDVVEYMGNHYDADEKLIDFSSLRENRLKLNLNFYMEMELCLFVLGVAVRHHGVDVEVLDISNNNIHNLSSCQNIRVFLPNLRKLVASGNPISKFPRFGDELELVADGFENQGGQDVDPGTAEIMSHGIEWKSARREAAEQRAPEPKAAEPADPRVSCLEPFIDYFVKASDGQWNSLAGCYTQDACFSLLAGKLNKENFGAIFKYISNRAFKNTNMVFTGRNEVRDKQKEIFPDGVKMTIKRKNLQVVSNLFFAVSLSGTISVAGNELQFIRSLVVVGRDGRLQISNDNLSLRAAPRGH